MDISGITDKQLNKHEMFASNYSGPLYVIISFTDAKIIGNLHLVKLGKLFTKNFLGVTNIIPIGSQSVRITFNSLQNANACLCSPWLLENCFSATIPSSLIYCLGVIHLDQCVSEEDFFEGLECRYKVINFRRINIKRDNTLIPSKLVRIKFLSPKLPENLCIFKVIYTVSHSIR